jgi:hypothetical protein
MSFLEECKCEILAQARKDGTMTDDAHHALKLWKRAVHDRREAIDPKKDIAWENMAFGFFLGQGLTPFEARSCVEDCRDLGWL